jgi:uncharacterized membrane protein
MAEAAGVPGKGWYALAGAISLGSIVAAVGLIIWLVMKTDEATQFLAPARHVLELRPGRHVVWNDYVTIFEGRSYDESKKLPPGARITVTEAGGGRSVTVRGGVSTTFKGTTTERVAVVEFDVERPGRYEIAVQGDFPPRVFSVGPDTIRLFLWSIFGAVTLVFIGIGAGIGIGAWAFIKREEAREAAARAGGAAAAKSDPREESLKRLTAIVYALQVASIFVGVTLFAGIIINYLKRDEAAGTWLESHFRWQIRTFWYSLLWLGVGLALLLVLVGVLVLMLAGMWMLYRAIKGWLELSENKPMYA